MSPDPTFATRPFCFSRLNIGYLITPEQLRGQVEHAYRTDSEQVTTTILWWSSIDAFSCRALAEALHFAADADHPGRIQAFAAVACELFRHTSQTLIHRLRTRRRNRRAGCFAGDGSRPPAPLISEATAAGESLRDELLTAINKLSKHIHPRRRVLVKVGTGDECPVREALSTLQGLFASVCSFLEQALQPYEPHLNREAVQAFTLETRRELQELEVCYTAGEVYVEAFAVTKSGDKSESIAVEVSLDVMKL